MGRRRPSCLYIPSLDEVQSLVGGDDLPKSVKDAVREAETDRREWDGDIAEKEDPRDQGER